MKHPPYHLRTNKAVDRLLLIDVLNALGSSKNFSDYTYYSLAGPFLEDLRVIDHFFPEMKLVSLESNEQTWKRQEFNRFCSRVDLKHIPFANFLLHMYEPYTKDIFWLDFTDLKFERFNEFQQLLKEVLPESVIRITLRAEPEISIGYLKDRFSDEEYLRLRDEWVNNFVAEFESVLPAEIDLNEAFEKITIFAKLVQGMVKVAASQALDTPGNDVDFLPIQCTRYSDNTQMVSITGIVLLRTEMEKARERLKAVRFANFDWQDCHKIDIPALTIKERLHLERYLPVRDGEDVREVLFNALGYMIDNGEKRSKLQLSHYADCHRSYPNFIQISI